MKRTEGPVLGITMGDPAGIGPELILKALSRLGMKGARIIGSRPVLEREQQRLKTTVDLSVVDDSVPDPGRFTMGRVQKNCGRAAFAALENGVELLRTGAIAALVTAPVSKQALRLAGFGWPGQTEFLAERLGCRRPAMLAWTPRFKVVFVTIHLPLALVAPLITARAVAEKIRMLAEFLKSEGKTRPRIGVMAFNPHAYEFSLGEEKRIMAGIRLARRSGIQAAGPLPADSAALRLGDFDGFVAMFHDQAMIPAKLLGRGRGVNVTLGLGRVRTSPLHGVAFDIAGTGQASPDSMIAALRLARRLAQRSRQ